MPSIKPVKITDRVDIEVGDVHSDKFQPQIKMKFWGNECNTSVRIVPDKDEPKITNVDNVITYIEAQLPADFPDAIATPILSGIRKQRDRFARNHQI